MQSTPSSAAALLLLLVSCAQTGCATWRGELDDRHNRRVAEHVRDIRQTDLRELSKAPPRTVQDDLESTQLRRKTLPAPETPAALPLSIADVRMTTLRNNLDLDVFFLEPKLAATVVSEEVAKFDATLFGSVAYQRKDLPSLDSDLVQFTSESKELDKAVAKLTQIEQTKEALSLDVGVNVPLPTGGVVRLRNTFDESNKLSPQRFEQYVAGLKFSYSQPLLRGAGVQANTASIRLARLSAQTVGATTKLSAIRVLAGAEKAYWRAYGARRMLDVRAQQYNLAFDNLELVRKRVAEGLSPSIEITRAEVGVAARLEGLIVAETNLRIQQRELKRVLNLEGVSLDSPTMLDMTTPPELLRWEVDRNQLAHLALDNRMEMLELELKLAANALKVDLARNRALPLFVLDFSYGVLDRQGSFGSAWRGMWDFDNTELSVGLRGEIPVTNDARESQLRRAVLERTQRMATRAQRKLAIQQEVYDALDVLDQNWQRIIAARQNVIVSGTNYEAELKQFEEGLRTMREVLEVLTQLGDAQIREINAIVAYQIAQIDLAFATGTLLGYAHVDLAPIPLADGVDEPG
ncbi:MAG: TolC family protein [Phycisphaerales bacterium]|nr:TolC family protein [Phycisphaerales bacterium]